MTHKVAQKVALMHKCNLAPTQSKRNDQNVSIIPNNSKNTPRNVYTETNKSGIPVRPSEHNLCAEQVDSIVINEANKSQTVTNSVLMENSVILPPRKKSKNLAKFFGVDEESASNPLPNDQKTVDRNIANGKDTLAEVNNFVEEQNVTSFIISLIVVSIHVGKT